MYEHRRIELNTMRFRIEMLTDDTRPAAAVNGSAVQNTRSHTTLNLCDYRNARYTEAAAIRRALGCKQGLPEA